MFDNLYDNNSNYFGLEPSDGLIEFLQCNNISFGTIIDIGAGEGRNSIYLAKEGFDVIAVEKSKIGCEKIYKNTFSDNISIKIINNDYNKIYLEENSIDIIISITGIEHMDFSEIKFAANKMKKELKVNGYIYIVAFSQNDPGFYGNSKISSECAKYIKHYFQINELIELFSDLEIIECKSYKKMDYSHGKPHEHGKIKLIAKKLSN